MTLPWKVYENVIGPMRRRVEGDDIETLERTTYVDHNAPTDLVFIVRLATTAAPENRDKVAKRFEDEVKLQFGSAVTVERWPVDRQMPQGGTRDDSPDSERAHRH